MVSVCRCLSVLLLVSPAVEANPSFKTTLAWLNEKLEQNPTTNNVGPCAYQLELNRPRLSLTVRPCANQNSKWIAPLNISLLDVGAYETGDAGEVVLQCQNDSSGDASQCVTKIDPSGTWKFRYVRVGFTEDRPLARRIRTALEHLIKLARDAADKGGLKSGEPF